MSHDILFEKKWAEIKPFKQRKEVVVHKVFKTKEVEFEDGSGGKDKVKL